MSYRSSSFYLFLILLPIAVIFVFFPSFKGDAFNDDVIDTHEHIQSIEQAEILLEANADKGISKTVLLPSPIETLTLNGHESFTGYRQNVDEILKIAETYPDDFIPLCTVSPLDTDALEYVKSCIERGGKGIKLYNGHSYYYDIFGLPLDSPRMMPIYAYAERNHVPLLYHINIQKYRAELENILKKYPDLVLSVPHFMVASTRLEQVEELMDEYPNLYTDVSFGSPEYMAAGLRRIGSIPEKFRAFIEKYPDRILFGTDMVLTKTAYKDKDFVEEVLQCYRDMLEQKIYTCNAVKDYYKKEFDTYAKAYEVCRPKEGKYCISKKAKMDARKKWYEGTKKINGLDLDAETLEKIYQTNPKRFLGISD